MSPNVYIIAGPNGIGKTTFAREFLPQFAQCRNFVNADLIAAGVAPFSPDAAAFHAGRLMLQEIASLAKRRVDFGFETTLSGRAHVNLVSSLKRAGYGIHLFFLWTPNVEVALSRVAERVRKGGHDVPAAVVRRRFDRSIRNFLWWYAPAADSWILFDNSETAPAVIASNKRGKLHIMNKQIYEGLVARYR